MSNLIKVGLILCFVWINIPIHGQGISRRLWRHADEVLLVKILKEEEAGGFGILTIGLCFTDITAEIVTMYKIKRLDAVQRNVIFNRIFSCHQPLLSDEGPLDPKKKYIVFLDSERPGKTAYGEPMYYLTCDFLGIHEYTNELDRILKRKRKRK